MNTAPTSDQPLPAFTILSAIAVVIGVVVGVGIFRLPAIVAGHSASELQFILFWLAGGLVSLLGALCYAELASSRPDAGGEYHFLHSAYGSAVGFLFSWGRMTVIQTGAIALVAFILGDYATLIFDLGPYSPAIYAALTVIVLTALNVVGTHYSRQSQNLFSGLIVGLLVLLSIAAFISVPPDAVAQVALDDVVSSGSGAGLAMIFVLLTYGGWNEAVYLSAEIRNVRRNMVRVLVPAIILITALYVLVNLAYLQVLGLEGLRDTDAVAAELSAQIFGSAGALLIAGIAIMAALSTANATILTGARTNYALGRDFHLLRFIGHWHPQRNTPVNALLVQGIIALALIGLGAWSKQAIATLVEFTAPVFWFFLTLTTITLFVFRYRHGVAQLPFRVPLYPLVPLLFLAACLYMLYSSLAYTGSGAFIGILVLASGVPVYWLASKRQ